MKEKIIHGLTEEIFCKCEEHIGTRYMESGIVEVDKDINVLDSAVGLVKLKCSKCEDVAVLNGIVRN